MPLTWSSVSPSDYAHAGLSFAHRRAAFGLWAWASTPGSSWARCSLSSTRRSGLSRCAARGVPNPTALHPANPPTSRRRASNMIVVVLTDHRIMEHCGRPTEWLTEHTDQLEGRAGRACDERSSGEDCTRPL
eukprot:5542580-Prymnesium_polylepis.1